MHCHCNSGRDFAECCEAIIRGKRKAETAEQLMRSRYSAYVVADIDYLLKSHHPTSRPVHQRKDILNWTKSVSWIGLQILNTQKGLANDTEGWVEFKATYLESGKLECIHEKSYFVKENEQWYYQAGEHK